MNILHKIYETSCIHYQYAPAPKDIQSEKHPTVIKIAQYLINPARKTFGGRFYSYVERNGDDDLRSDNLESLPLFLKVISSILTLPLFVLGSGLMFLCPIENPSLKAKVFFNNWKWMWVEDRKEGAKDLLREELKSFSEADWILIFNMVLSYLCLEQSSEYKLYEREIIQIFHSKIKRDGTSCINFIRQMRKLIESRSHYNLSIDTFCFLLTDVLNKAKQDKDLIYDSTLISELKKIISQPFPWNPNSLEYQKTHTHKDLLFFQQTYSYFIPLILKTFPLLQGASFTYQEDFEKLEFFKWRIPTSWDEASLKYYLIDIWKITTYLQKDPDFLKKMICLPFKYVFIKIISSYLVWDVDSLLLQNSDVFPDVVELLSSEHKKALARNLAKQTPDQLTVNKIKKTSQLLDLALKKWDLDLQHISDFKEIATSHFRKFTEFLLSKESPLWRFPIDTLKDTLKDLPFLLTFDLFSLLIQKTFESDETSFIYSNIHYLSLSDLKENISLRSTFPFPKDPSDLFELLQGRLQFCLDNQKGYDSYVKDLNTYESFFDSRLCSWHLILDKKNRPFLKYALVYGLEKALSERKILCFLINFKAYSHLWNLLTIEEKTHLLSKNYHLRKLSDVDNASLKEKLLETISSRALSILNMAIRDWKSDRTNSGHREVLGRLVAVFIENNPEKALPFLEAIALYEDPQLLDLCLRYFLGRSRASSKGNFHFNCFQNNHSLKTFLIGHYQSILEKSSTESQQELQNKFKVIQEQHPSLIMTLYYLLSFCYRRDFTQKILRENPKNLKFTIPIEGDFTDQGKIIKKEEIENLLNSRFTKDEDPKDKEDEKIIRYITTIANGSHILENIICNSSDDLFKRICSSSLFDDQHKAMFLEDRALKHPSQAQDRFQNQGRVPSLYALSLAAFIRAPLWKDEDTPLSLTDKREYLEDWGSLNLYDTTVPIGTELGLIE